jgi:arylsulfatase
MTDPIERQTLPMPDRAFGESVPFDVRDVEGGFPPITPLRPPAGSPNVLVVLLDDVVFGAASEFGGPCRTPTAERLGAGA